LRRARAVLALAGTAFIIGAIVGASHTASASHELAARFVAAWAKRDYGAMYLEIDSSSRRALSPSQFASAYEDALRTATATRLQIAGKPRDVHGRLVAVPVRVDTRLFGRLALSFELEISSAGSGDTVNWSRSLAFPGLRPGEALGRNTVLPRRATLLARDESVLAEGAATSAGQRSSPLGETARAVVGEVGPLPAARRHALEAQGVPADADVGVSGLELALDDRLRGIPGGQLLAVDLAGTQPARRGQSPEPVAGTPVRVLASAKPHAAPAVRTTISPAVQRAAVLALGGQFGGIVALVPSTGQILAVAGIGLNSVQPPGSTFKMVTVTGVLAAHIASSHSVFPYATYSTLDGVKLNNANGEECGGTLENAFAVSCNSVFAPLGVKLGAARLVATAEGFGFNHDPGIEGAAESTLPAASEIQGELDVGSTAIGQGQVQASALEMATVAATIADGGRRPQATFTPAARPLPRVPVMSSSVARVVRRLMTDVVREGTGTAAAIPGVVVAGKTGTAELKTESECSTPPPETTTAGAREPSRSGCQGTDSEASNTDAWFAAFAPAIHPRIVVGVLLVKDGAGGATAAPVARQVLEAGLKAGG
jgi:peptidoglycan glycosyltransferase